MVNNIPDYNNVSLFRIMFSFSILLYSSIDNDRCFGAGRCAIIDGCKNNLTVSPSSSCYWVFLPTLRALEWATERPLHSRSRWARAFQTTWFESLVELMCCCVLLVCVRLVLWLWPWWKNKTTLILVDDSFSLKWTALCAHIWSSDHLELGQ